MPPRRQPCAAARRRRAVGGSEGSRAKMPVGRGSHALAPGRRAWPYPRQGYSTSQAGGGATAGSSSCRQADSAGSRQCARGSRRAQVARVSAARLLSVLAKETRAHGHRATARVDKQKVGPLMGTKARTISTWQVGKRAGAAPPPPVACRSARRQAGNVLRPVRSCLPCARYGSARPSFQRRRPGSRRCSAVSKAA